MSTESENTFANPATVEENSPISAIDVLSDPAKLVTYFALYTAGEPATFQQIAHRANRLQGTVPAKEFVAQDADSHCQLSFKAAGLIDIGTTNSKYRSNPVLTAILNERGATDGLAAAGALADIQLTAEHDSFLQKALGVRAYTKTPNPRIALYEHLLRQSYTQRQLGTLAGVTERTVAKHVRILSDHGIIERTSLTDPANRTFCIVDTPGRVRSYTGAAGRALVSAAEAFYKNGQLRINGQDMLDKARQLDPSIDSATLWHTFLRWIETHAGRGGYLQEIDRPSAGRLALQISDAYYPDIERLVQARNLLAADTKQGKDFREDSIDRALAIISSKAQVSALFASLEQQVSGTRSNVTSLLNNVEHIVLEHGPTGIEVNSLHRLALQSLTRYISYAQFRSLLNRIPLIQVESRRAVTSAGIKTQRYATIRTTSYPSDWPKDAACKAEDPEKFYPVGTAGPALKQAAEAKKICQSCPVREACLKAALDNAALHDEPPAGIQGGVWFDAGELTPPLKHEVMSTITIESRPRTA